MKKMKLLTNNNLIILKSIFLLIPSDLIVASSHCYQPSGSHLPWLFPISLSTPLQFTFWFKIAVVTNLGRSSPLLDCSHSIGTKQFIFS